MPPRSRGTATPQRLLLSLLALAALFSCTQQQQQMAGEPHAQHKYSTRVIRSKYGSLRGLELRGHPPVEAYLGVPYATPPLGSLRYMPPVTPSPWRGVRLADRMSPVCPQALPSVADEAEALLRMPRSRLRHLRRLLPLLVNQSEDCLYLNLYVPKTADARGLPVVLFVHGESYSWNSGNVYDGSALAGKAGLIAVTVNYRLGVLGFLKTGGSGSAQGNFGLMDLVAGLHWLRESVPAFGGDPENISLMGHGTGAALANILAVSPVSEELVRRAVLLSGCALAPWALQSDPLSVKRRVAEATGCHGDLLGDDIAPCLRDKSVEELLKIRIEPPRFLSGFAPFIDGTVLPRRPARRLTLPLGSSLADASGLELADFPSKQLLLGLTSTESYNDLSAQDLEFGFNETRRDRLLRTYVRNVYHFHLNEIFSALKNEYTDWERPSTGGGFAARDSALQLLSDGHGAAPVLRLAQLHSLRGGRGYFVHFRHETQDLDFPQRIGTVFGEDLPFVLGLPGPPLFPVNSTVQDRQVADLLLQYLANFARTGNPNGPSTDSRPDHTSPQPYWDSYDTINQLYLELGGADLVSSVRTHYRGHKLSAWLSLIPQLHGNAATMSDLPSRHHHFREEGPQYYDGSVRPQSVFKSAVRPTSTKAPISTTPTPKETTTTTSTAISTECVNTTNVPGVLLVSTPVTIASNNDTSYTGNNLLRSLATKYHSYATALGVTIAVGCFLLLLNVLIFAGIYHQRGRGRRRGDNSDKKSAYNDHEKTKVAEQSKQSPPQMHRFGEYSCYDEKLSSCAEKRPLADVALCEYRRSPGHGPLVVAGCTTGIAGQGSGTHTPSRSSIAGSSSYNTSSRRCSSIGVVLPETVCRMQNETVDSGQTEGSSTPLADPDQDIPEPPPPPRNQPPQSGILRASSVVPAGAGKKRVQIQEISV